MKSGVGQNIAMHASLAARNFFLAFCTFVQIKVSSVENLALKEFLPLRKSGVGQNIAMHASLAARNFFLAFCTFVVHSPWFFPTYPEMGF